MFGPDCVESTRPLPSVRPSIVPLSLTNRGAAFLQCPLSKHLYCGVLLTLLCQTKPRSQWNNPAGRRPPPGSSGAAPKQPDGARAHHHSSRIQSSPATLTYLPDKHCDLFFFSFFPSRSLHSRSRCQSRPLTQRRLTSVKSSDTVNIPQENTRPVSIVSPTFTLLLS